MEGISPGGAYAAGKSASDLATVATNLNLPFTMTNPLTWSNSLQAVSVATANYNAMQILQVQCQSTLNLSLLSDDLDDSDSTPIQDKVQVPLAARAQPSAAGPGEEVPTSAEVI